MMGDVLLWTWSELKPSLPEFEFQSNTEADPVLNDRVGELVKLSIGTKT